MGNKLIKNHLFFHLPEYIKLWGIPSGRDSAPSKSHHKTEIKAPSKNTHDNAATLMNQTANRKQERVILQTATYEYKINHIDGSTNTGQTCPAIAGSHFHLMRSNTEA
eukprot:6273229-Ditylum_brightwellii.AAC.1